MFLSRKEGDNKALVEAMFTDVPGDRARQDGRRRRQPRINAATGVLSSDDDLADKIQYVIDHPQEFSAARLGAGAVGERERDEDPQRCRRAAR